MLDPAGAAAHEAAALWWPTLAVASVVLVAVSASWIYAMRRRPREVGAEAAQRIGRRWIIGGGVVLPLASVALLLGFGVPAGYRMLPLPVAGEAPLRVEVTASQWRWEVRYPDSGVVLEDELHLPAGQPVDVHVRSADVIHSLWVPRLAGKIDAIPGRTTMVRLRAEGAAVHRGQCSEYCGVGHARMVLRVRVHEAEDFAAWLREQAPTASAPDAAAATKARGGAP